MPFFPTDAFLARIFHTDCDEEAAMAEGGKADSHFERSIYPGFQGSSVDRHKIFGLVSMISFSCL